MTRSRMRWAALSLFSLSFVLSGCPDPEPTIDDVVFGEKLGLPACDDATIGEYPDHRCFTYRAVGGVSMGGGASSRLAFSHPELFDVVGVMGTPFADLRFLWEMILGNHLSGFCPLEQLEAEMALDPASLNDPTNPNVFCGSHDSWPMEGSDQVAPGLFPVSEGSACSMFRSDFNNWYQGPEEGRGGGFGRNGLHEIFHDMVAAFGNPLTYNPDSNYFPVGVPETWHVTPGDNDFDIASLCDNPIVLEGVYNREYNPDGSYDVITFCDGNTDGSGIYDPTDANREKNVIEFALAVDLNGNGKRDYAEPILLNARERWADFGADGLADEDEAGYDSDSNKDPAGDNWDPVTNPTGTEGNWKVDEGEDWDDDGLDGVPATGDFGEGNGDYDVSPTLQRLFDRSPTELYDSISDDQVARLDVWMDAGIRDFLNTAQITNSLFATMAARVPDAKAYDDFPTLPGIDGPYVYFDADYTRSAMGQIAYLRYGDQAICPGSDDILGDGNHVGPDIIHRLYTLFGFLSARMPPEGRDRSIGGDVIDLESPNGTIGDFGFLENFYSETVGRDVDYGVMLPPDYYLSDRQEERYPVLYYFHGQGMNASDMVAIGLVLWGAMKEANSTERIEAGLTDFQRAIIIWADGECLGDECWTGNFYADFEGLPRDDRRYEGAFIDLMNHVEDTYRVKKPRLVPKGELK
jgi:hypothetical protein